MNDASPIFIEDDPRDVPSDRLLCGLLGKAVVDAYPDWEWRVEIPPEQQVVIVRNLTVNHKGNYGYVIHRGKVSDLKVAAVIGAGALLERYEHIKKHTGKFRPDDVDPFESLFLKPEE